MGEDLQGCVGYIWKNFVNQATDENRDPKSGTACYQAFFRQGFVKRGGTQGHEMPVGQKRRNQTGTGGALGVGRRFCEKALETAGPVHQGVKPSRVGQQFSEDQFFGWGQAFVFRQNGTGFDENFHHIDPGRAVGGTRSAQQAPVEPLVHPVGISKGIFHETGEQGQLSPGHIRLPAGLLKQGTDRLAHAAPDAGHQLVFQFFYQVRQLFHVRHYRLHPRNFTRI